MKQGFGQFKLIALLGLLAGFSLPVMTFAEDSRLPIKFSMVQYLQHTPNIRNNQTDLGFSLAYELNQRLDIGLAYRSYGGNRYYYITPGEWVGKLAERTLIYTNYGMLDYHFLKNRHAPYLRFAAGMAGVTEEQIVLYTTHYNYTWVPTAMIGAGVDIKAYKNVLVSTQCEFLYLPYYKQDIVTNPPWILQVGLGLTFR